jgi:hypothetical protein
MDKPKQSFLAVGEATFTGHVKASSTRMISGREHTSMAHDVLFGAGM